YGCHYLVLKFLLQQGLHLRRVHKVCRFKQSRWLAGYIQLNTEMRTKTKAKSEQDFYKLMNNSVYGKTCENQKKRSDIRLVTNKAQCNKLISKPHCKNYRIFHDKLAAIELARVDLKIDKPFYVGFSVLEISKLLMAKFHYEF